MQTSYVVIDLLTKTIVGRYLTRKTAIARADRLDLAYGAIRYSVKEIEQ